MPEKNPLIVPILRILQSTAEPLDEHSLLKMLQEDGHFPALAKQAQLALFQKHFLIMNALYHLQQQLWQQGWLLEVSPLRIAIHLASENAGESLPGFNQDQALRDYYLDWQQLRATDEEGVNELLNGFWQRFVSEDQQYHSLQVLELPADADWAQIRSRYRQLAAEHHPDRGGEPQQFMAIREAYELLQRVKG